MEAHVYGYIAAMAFKPTKPTVAIRIHDYATRDYIDARGNWDNSPAAPLMPSPHWVDQFGYRFCDIDVACYGIYEGSDVEAKFREEFKDRLITPEIAEQLVSDVAGVVAKAEAMLFHCNAGLSRSPATALAIRDIFKLDFVWQGRAIKLISRIQDTSHDGFIRNKEDIVGNLTVYRELVSAAERLGIKNGN